MATANDLRKGMAINYNGEVVVITDSQHRTPGNLRAFVQVTMRNLRSGKTLDKRFSSTEKVEIIPLHNVPMEYSYKDGNDFVFTDPETYETVTVPSDVVGDAVNYLVENAVATLLFVQDRVVQMELPPSVTLTVTESPEAIRGDTASNVQKTVTLETGINIQVPLFIKQNEKIRVDTRTGKYMERA